MEGENKNNSWGLQAIWNDSVAQKARPPRARDYIWAGDIGKSFYERYLKMQGKPPDKPKEDRVLRKFSAGLWFEHGIEEVLETIGILKSSQQWLEIPETQDTLRVTGKLDFLAGGIANWAEARQRVMDKKYPEFIENVSIGLIDHFEKEYPNGLEEIVIEVKSVNSQVFWAKKDYLSEAYPHHEMQLYTYLKALNKPKGTIVYISKDDLTIQEMGVVYPSAALERRWQEDVRAMTTYWREKQEPPKPESLVFSKKNKIRFQLNKKKVEIRGAWIKNWEVGWSDYFETITGMENVEAWEKLVETEARRRNNLIKEEYLAKVKNQNTLQ